MSLAIDGLVSGLDTTALINSLMQLEAVPQTLLKNKVSTTQDLISALQGLNSKVAALADLAETTAKPGALDLYSATGSAPTVTATVSSGAQAGGIEFTVDQLSQSQVSVTDAVTAWPSTSLTLTDADGAATTITAASTSLDDVVSAVNAAEAGVTALKVAAGTDPVSGDPLFRIQFSATETGAAGAFGVSGTTVPLTLTTAAQDAELTLWAGTAAAQTITSGTNTFTDVLPGVAITVTAASAEPVSVTVARDDDRIKGIAENLVGKLNETFALISTKSAVTDSTGPDGSPKVSGGVFTGDSAVRSLNQRILSAASAPVDGRSPSEIGIVLTKTGTLEFDAEKFATAMAADPAGVEATLQEIASRIAVVGAEASDKFDGLITSRITGQESLVENMGTQIEDWGRRLESRRSNLERIYSAMEVRLSSLNAQSSWLMSQLPSLAPPDK